MARTELRMALPMLCASRALPLLPECCRSAR